MRLNWHSTTHGVSTLYVDGMAVAYVHRFRTDIYGVHTYNGSAWTLVGEFPTREEARAHVWDCEGARWCDLGVFPSVAEAKAAVETLAPLYWRDY